MDYDDAISRQRAEHERVLGWRESGDPRVGTVLLVEHDPPVITVSRRESAASHLLADEARLAGAGVQVRPTDRGGDITYHGPGQLVVYPILDLNRLGLGLHAYMRSLEQCAIDVCAHFGVPAGREPGLTGVWTAGRAGDDGPTRKIAAMGVRVRRWVSMHGLALNVTTDLDHFGFIVPCGIGGRTVTSLGNELGARTPSMAEVKRRTIDALAALFGAAVER